jgi:vacuolar protein-sorting-associated protein 4
LFGPPGTGKSYLAKACATECEGTFFSVSSSDLVSKWMGESEKLIKSLFQMAREAKPSIIFIDEVDSLCGSRSEGENDSSRRIKTEFLVQMQGTATNNDGVLVLGATNVPWELDNAIRRRFQKRVHIGLPEAPARAGIFKIRSGKTKTTIDEAGYAQLGEASHGYSGSDIANVVNEALMLPVRRCQTATKFKKVADAAAPNGQWFVPCAPSDPMGEPMKLMQVPPAQLKAPEVCFEDYMEALQNVKPSVNEEDIEEHHKWTAEFGQDG